MPWPVEGADIPVDLAKKVAIAVLVAVAVGRLIAPDPSPSLVDQASWPALVGYSAAHPELAVPAGCAAYVSASPTHDQAVASGSAAEFSARCDALRRELSNDLRGKLVVIGDRGLVQAGVVTHVFLQPSLFGGLAHALILALTLPWLIALWGGRQTAVAALIAATLSGLAAAYFGQDPLTPVYGATALTAFATGAFAWRSRDKMLVWPDHLLSFSPPEALAVLPSWTPLALGAAMAVGGVGASGPLLSRLVLFGVGAAVGAGIANSMRGGGREQAQWADPFDRRSARPANRVEAAAAPATSATPATPATPASPSVVVAPTLAAAIREPAPAAEPVDDVWATLLDNAHPFAVAAFEAKVPHAEDVGAIARAVATQPATPQPATPQPATPQPATPAVEATIATRPDALRKHRAIIAAQRLLSAAEGKGEATVAALLPKRGLPKPPAGDDEAPGAMPDDIEDVEPAEAFERDADDEPSMATTPTVKPSLLPATGLPATGLPATGPQPLDPATVALDHADVTALRVRSGAVPTLASVDSTRAYDRSDVESARAAIAAGRLASSRAHVQLHEAPTAVVAGLAAVHRVSVRERAATGYVATLDDGKEVFLAPAQVRGVVVGIVTSDGADHLPVGTFELADLYVERERGIERWRLPAAAVHFARVAPGRPKREAWHELLMDLASAGAQKLPSSEGWPSTPASSFPNVDSFVAVARRAGLCTDARG